MIPDIQPLAALRLGGSLARRDGDRLVASCPHCGGTADIAYQAFHCASSACSWSRGGGLDYLARKLGGYPEAIRVAGRENPYFRNAGAGEVTRHRQRRALLEFFIEQESRSHDSDAERLILRHEFQAATGIDHRAFGRGHLYLREEDADRLVYLLAVADITPPSNLQGRPVILIPYWAFPHVLSHVLVVSDRLSRAKECWVYPHRYAWFGLSQKHPRCERVAVFPTYSDAMAREELFRLNHPTWFPTHLYVNPGQDAKGLVPAHLDFHGDTASWAMHLPAWSVIDGFATARFHDNGRVHDLPELMSALLLRSLEHGFMEFLDLCGAMQLDAATRSRLTTHADLMHDRRRAGELRQALSRRMLDSGDNYTLYEGANGYELETPKNRNLLSNFTLLFDTMVSFSATADLHFQGRAVIGNAVHPFDIPGKAFDSPAALQRALGGIAHRAEEPEARAVIYRHAEFRKILAWMVGETAELPRQRGVRHLGWSLRCDSFTTPDVAVDEAGSHKVVYYPDEAGDHDCFRSGQPALGLSDSLPPLDPAFAGLVAALVGQVVRFFHHRKLRPLAVRNDEAGRRQGLRLFQGLGQYKPLRLTSILPRNLELNRGLPCLIGGLDPLKAARLPLAGLWLGDEGFDLATVPEAQIDAVASLLPALLQEVTRRLLAGSLKGCLNRRSVRLDTALTAEGTAILREGFWAEWPQPLAPWAAVDRLLGDREQELRRLARVDEAAATVSFPEELWRGLGFDQETFARELGGLGARLSAGAEPGTVVADRHSAYLMFDEYYGAVPELASA